MRISQSFMKSMRAYLEGKECGHIIRETYVNGKFFDSEEPGAKELGSFVEYHVSGALPKNGIIPKAVNMKDGTPNVQYRLALINSKRIKDMLAEMHLKIIKAGHKLTRGKFDGTLDLIVEAEQDTSFCGFPLKKGDRIIIDLKYSGLLDDKWTVHGWIFSPIQKRYHGIQAIQYHFIGKLPFFFWVTQSNNKEGTDSEMKVIHIPVDEFMIEQHIAEGNSLLEHFEMHKEMGFTPHPSLSKCQKCPIRKGCPDRRTLPEIHIVNLNED